MALFEIIRKRKYDENIVWKYPKTNFNTGSQLIVEETQEALFFSTGKALDLFPAGKYTLKTNNIPLLRDLINIPTGFRTPFTCQIYFIDISEKIIKWGTSSKIEFLDPIYKFPIQIGACGELKFKIEDSRKLLLKLVGINKTFNETKFDEFFNSQILVKVKTYIANVIKDNNICIFEIDSQLEKMSLDVKKILIDEFKEYGIKLIDFYITTIAKPEDDKQYLTYKELFFKKGVGLENSKIDRELEKNKSLIEADRIVIESEAQALKRKQEGYTYQEEKKLDALQDAANNEAIGQYTNLGMGLGIMTGISNPIGEKVNQEIVSTIKDNRKVCKHCNTENDSESKYCKKCGQLLNEQIKFCPHCGSKIMNDSLYCSYCGKKVENDEK